MVYLDIEVIKMDAGTDLQFLYNLVESAINSLKVLNHMTIMGYGLLDILIALAVLSIIVPILFKLAGYDIGDD